MALLLLAQSVRAEETQAVQWAIRLPQDPVAFRGMTNLDDGGAPGTMAYPAVGGVAGLLVGIATHAAVAGMMRDHQKSALEIEADKVLTPNLADLAAYKQAELMPAALGQSGMKQARVLAAEEQAPDAWVMQSAPVFSMTQDRSALILENSVTVVKPGAKPDRPSYQNTVRVVSQVHDAPDLAAYWSADGSKALKAESAALMARSLDIAAADASAPHPAPGPVRTVRYAQGKKQTFERAEVVSEQCGRALIRNLRGWLMSVPLLHPSSPAQEGCAAGQP